MNDRNLKSQPWLHSAVLDGLFILFPPFFALLVVFSLPKEFTSTTNMPLHYWFILIVCVDVAHVYATLYRTYFNEERLQSQYNLLISVPIACYCCAVFLYHINDLLFWRILAYLAVFHFIRQQYGFMRLYSKKDKHSGTYKIIDQLIIYTATLYPILHWHLTGERNFNWFIENDFYLMKSPVLLQIANFIYFSIIIVYLIKELRLLATKKQLNYPKNILIIGTLISWYFGIIYFNGDLAFTMLNVVSHGIPYIALIWFFEKKNFKIKPSENLMMKINFKSYGLWTFLSTIVILAIVEESLWDIFIWQEHITDFSFLTSLPPINNEIILSLVVPLLALPQMTHYIMDGFIWKIKKND